MWVDNTLFTADAVTIENFVAFRSESLLEYMQERRASTYFTMWYKTLTHSDLTTRGKRTNSSDGFERNLLYYLSVADMNNLQREFPDKKFECAKQSNIGMPKDFYKDIEAPDPRECRNHPMAKDGKIRINDFTNVYLVNDTLEFFSLDYSEKMMNVLGKEMPGRWKNAAIVLDNNSPFTEIELHEAVHGLGVEGDSVFHALRLTMFLNDTIVFIKEHDEINPKLFILLEKNALFYYLMGMRDKRWADAERIRRYQERIMIKEGLTIDPPERLYENEWDNTFLP